MKRFNFMVFVSFALIFLVVLALLICLVFLFIYHLVLFLLSDDIGVREENNNVGYFLRHYKFCRIRIFTISGEW